MKVAVKYKDECFDVMLEKETNDVSLVKIGGKKIRVVMNEKRGAICTAYVDRKKVDFGYQKIDKRCIITLDGIDYELEIVEAGEIQETQTQQAGIQTINRIEIKAQIPGRISGVIVKEGQTIAKNRPLLTLEAMKMENEILSPAEGVVKSVPVQVGMTVDKGDTLVVIER